MLSEELAECTAMPCNGGTKLPARSYQRDRGNAFATIVMVASGRRSGWISSAVMS